MPASASTRSAWAAPTLAFSAISAQTASLPIFGSLSRARKSGCGLSGQSQLFEQAVEHQAIVDANLETLEADGAHQVVNDQRRLDVAGVGRGADGVEVALPEFAIAAMSGVLAAPDRAHVIALERRAELADVLGGEAGERHGQIEAQGHVAAAIDP